VLGTVQTVVFICWRSHHVFVLKNLASTCLTQAVQW